MNENDENSAASQIENEVTLDDVWNAAVREIKQIDPKTENWKNLSLPLARIKKIMKSEDFIAQELERERQRQANPGAPLERDRQKMKFMISQEAPVLVTKACELMIKELTIRAWQHTERSRRRTLQRADIHAAVGEDETFDFLIDIIPRGMTSAAPVYEGNQQVGETQGINNMVAVPQELAQDPSNQFGTLLQQMQQGVDGRQLQHNSDTQQNFSTSTSWNDTGL
ncbi:hypothetical protein FisN_8Hh084 [Fistulifera solaris]|uniref:Core Histone H2A/H2B/H3 domain-containing protein n=1 Tax=Fistulifera solaris TaxID=1519565 RepID=A0A1Z5JJ86_FISSO|nr:hypothetical protein FisN_8Hh084 [Fistulifera solaris]|eukprot:GAX14080.1 hypothetical protein FisN_8Hh084 [Fistulifera solaris]